MSEKKTDIFSTKYVWEHAFGEGTTSGGGHFDSSPSANSGSGETFNGVAGENLVLGDIVYYNSDAKYYKADANATTTMPCVAMAMATISGGTTGLFLSRGWVNKSTWTWNVGGSVTELLFVSVTTVGAMAQSTPGGAADQVQLVGYAKAADIIYFNPQYVIVEI